MEEKKLLVNEYEIDRVTNYELGYGTPSTQAIHTNTHTLAIRYFHRRCGGISKIDYLPPIIPSFLILTRWRLRSDAYLIIRRVVAYTSKWCTYALRRCTGNEWRKYDRWWGEFFVLEGEVRGELVRVERIS